MPKLPLIACAVVLAAFMAGGFGCAPVQAPPPARGPSTLNQEVDALLALGRERQAQGRLQEATDAYRAALRLKPDSGRTARAMLGMAKAADARGDKAEALDWVERMLAGSWDSASAMQAELLAARLELDLGKTRQAVTRLRRIMARPPGPMDQGQRRQVRELLVRALMDDGRNAEAAAELVRQAKEGGPSLARELAPLLARAASEAQPEEMQKLLAGAAWPEVRASLLLGMARGLVRRGKLEEAERILAQLRSSPASGAWRAEIRDLDRQVTQARMVAPRGVGVILPLSGPYAAYGRQVLAAVELGLGLFSGPGSNPPTLYIEDSRSDPGAAAEAVSKLVGHNKVVAIIGPMGASTSLAAARRAQKLGVPLFTLAQVQGVTLAGEYVFQNSITPAEQVNALLNRIMGDEGLKRLAVLAPSNSYGKGFAKLAAAGAADRGGVLVRTVYYDPKATDFTAEVKRLVLLPPGNYRPGHPDSPKPVIEFDAVFIPDGPDRAAMLIPQLTYYDVVGVRVLGTNLWHNPKLLQVGGRYVEGVVFPDAFNPGSSDAKVREFVEDFRQAMDQGPNVIAAHGYDAALAVRHILNGPRPPRTRGQFREELARLAGAFGVCGLLHMGPDRRLRNELNLFTVKRGAFQVWSPGGAGDEALYSSDAQAGSPSREGQESRMDADGREHGQAIDQPNPIQLEVVTPPASTIPR